MNPYYLLLAALLFRSVTVLCGFASLYLGYKLFLKGVLDPSELEGGIHNARISVKRAAPGIFFVCLGAAVMISAIWHTPIRYEEGPNGRTTVVSAPEKEKPVVVSLPDKPSVVVKPKPASKIIVEMPELVPEGGKMLGAMPPKPEQEKPIFPLSEIR